jgi:NAD(P)-dependent dehydrogenase (short-subunit alcohol dehydrogenase family)
MMKSIEELFSLSGRVALITGGAGDIGKAIAGIFLSRGARVYICGRNAANLDEAAAELSAIGECHAIAGDVATVAGAREVIATLAAREKQVHILVHNAGASRYAPIDDFSESDWDDVFDVNLKAAFFLVQALLPQLRAAATAAQPSTVINIGSSSGSQASGTTAISYATSKNALNYLTRKLARLLADDHITVNTVGPGPVDAGLMKMQDDAFKARLIADIPMGRMATVDEVANAALFLASPAAAFITGAILPVDGGVTGCLK